MTMTPKGWSISALATELNMDRRTVASRLRNTPPSGTVKGSPVWHLDVAVKALKGVGPAVEETPPPEGFEILTEVHEPYRMYVIAALAGCYSIAGIVRSAAVEMGIAPKQARELALGSALGLMGFYETDLKKNGVSPFNADEPPAWLSEAVARKIAASL